MQTSIFLAKLIGPVFLAVGAGLLLNREGYREMAEEFLDSRALIYLTGLLALVPGIALVLAHNVWAADWRVIVTIFGWLAVLGGVFRIVFPNLVSEIGTSILENPVVLTLAGVAVIALGAILSFYGYFA